MQRSADSVADVTGSVSSSTFGPPYAGVGDVAPLLDPVPRGQLRPRSSSDSGWVYSSSKPPAMARIALMSKAFVPLGVSFCRPYVSLPSWPQLPPAPSPPA